MGGGTIMKLINNEELTPLAFNRISLPWLKIIAEACGTNDIQGLLVFIATKTNYPINTTQTPIALEIARQYPELFHIYHGYTSFDNFKPCYTIITIRPGVTYEDLPSALKMYYRRGNKVGGTYAISLSNKAIDKNVGNSRRRDDKRFVRNYYATARAAGGKPIPHHIFRDRTGCLQKLDISADKKDRGLVNNKFYRQGITINNERTAVWDRVCSAIQVMSTNKTSYMDKTTEYLVKHLSRRIIGVYSGDFENDFNNVMHQVLENGENWKQAYTHVDFLAKSKVDDSMIVMNNKRYYSVKAIVKSFYKQITAKLNRSNAHRKETISMYDYYAAQLAKHQNIVLHYCIKYNVPFDIIGCDGYKTNISNIDALRDIIDYADRRVFGRSLAYKIEENEENLFKYMQDMSNQNNRINKFRKAA